MRFKNKLITAILLTLTASIFFASCGKQKKPAEESGITIPEDFESADEVIDPSDNAADVKQKIEASAQYGVGLSITAFSFLQADVSEWQGYLLKEPGTYALDNAAGTGMTISFAIREGDALSYYKDGSYVIPLKDLKKFSEAIFGKDYVTPFMRELKSGKSLQGYELQVSSNEVTVTQAEFDPEAVTQFDDLDMTDNGDGTYTATATYYIYNSMTGEMSDTVAGLSYSLSETDKNPTGYQIIDWTMEVY